MFKRKAIICDLDGTLCLKGDRKFNDYMSVGEDKVNYPIRCILQMADTSGYDIILVSGREDKDYCRSITEAWLTVHNIRYNSLFMRKFKDFRSDDIVKKEIYIKLIQPNYQIEFVLDDRDKVVKMWRDLGLTCLQVAEGNFTVFLCIILSIKQLIS